MGSPAQWSALFNIVYEEKPHPVDALFVHGWGDLYEEMLELTARFFKDSGARYIVLNGESAYDDIPDAKGITYWRSELSRMDVPGDVIQSVRPARHTLEEAKGFIEFAQQHRILRAAVLSVPQHLLRAFLTDLGVMKDTGATIALYAYTLSRIDWDKEIEVHGLSGSVPERTTRAGRLVGECARIMEYRRRMEQGEEFTIASVPEALAYLQKRDTNV